jgi:hypothetical protein
MKKCGGGNRDARKKNASACIKSAKEHSLARRWRKESERLSQYYDAKVQP